MPQVTVTIAGKTYRMACGEGEERHLEGLAASFDARIGDMRKAFGEIGDMRLHVMAALTLADELAESKRRMEAMERETASLRESTNAGSAEREAAAEAGVIYSVEEWIEGASLLESGLVADAWLSPDPSQALALLIRQSNLMKLPEPLALDTLLTYLQQTLPPLSQSLGIPLALAVDSFSLIEQAQQRLFEHTLMLSTRLEAQQKSSEALLNDYTQLEQRSRIDPLTQLANRAWLEEQLRERFALCRAQQRTLSVVFIDLDHFKVLNDRYGHQAGDQVLAQFGSTLSALTRAGDLAGRYGGEEFLVLLPDETARTAEHFAERIAQRLQASPMVQVVHESLYISVSIGIACLDDGEFDNEREIIDAADQSMYTIKRAGRGGIAVYGRDLPSR
mgnify:CR=1 FL=1